MAINNNGSLSFELQLKMAQFKEDAKRASQELSKLGKTAEDEGKRIDNSFSNIGRNLSSLGILVGAQQLVKEIVRVRGEFQKLDVAFTTMLGSQEKATALMNQLVRTAATTPFGLQDVAGGAKQLLAYGMEAEKINDTLIRLGDIAAGLSIPLGDMTYLFGTTMVQGRMYTQDLNQFVGRGIPLIKEFAEQFGVAESEVKNLVTEGKIGFPELEKAIIAMTSEGGQFAGLMEAQSKTIAGQVANLEDAIESMFNSIGTDTQDIISGTLTAITNLVENYEKVGKVLLSLVSVFGVYKTAVMAMTAVYSLQAAGIGALTLAEKLHYTWLVLVEKAQKILNKTMLTNPYVLVATAIAGVVAYMISLKTETELLAEANEKYEADKQKVIEAEEEHMRKMNELIDIAGNEALSTDTRRNALVKLEMQYPSIFAQYDTEYEKLKNIKKIKEEIAALEAGKSIQNVSNELDRNLKRIAELEAKAKTKHLVGYDASGMAIYEGGLSAHERAELKALQEKNKELEKINKQKQREQYLTNLNVVGEKTLNAEIQARKDLLARMKANGKSRGKIAGNLAGEYSSDELQAQLNLMESELKRRKSPQKTAAEWKKYYQDQYEAKRKAYNDYLKQSGKIDQMTFETEAKRLKDEMDAAKKKADAYKVAKDPNASANAKAAEEAEKEAKQQQKLQQELADDLLQMQQDNEQREIDAMDEGTAKRLRQIRYDFKVRKAEIEKQANEWKTQNIEAGIATGGNGLTEEQTRAINIANRQNEQSRSKSVAEVHADEKRSMNEYLAEYGNLQEQKLALAELYAEKIANAVNDGEKKALQAQYRDAVSAIDIEINKSVSVISKAFGDMSDKTSKELRTIADDAEYAYNFLKGGKWDDTQGMLFGMSKDTFDSIRSDNALMEELVTIIKKLRDNADDAAVGFDKIKQGLDKLKDAGNDVEKLREAISLLREGFGVFGDAIGFVGDSLGKLGDAFGNDTLSDISEGISGVLGAMDSAFKGAEAGTIFGPIGMAAGAALGFVSSLAQSIGQLFDKKHERKIKALQGQIDDLGRAYDRLGDTLDNVYSRDAAAILKEQNVNLAKQKALIQQQIKEEEAKWKTDKDKIKAWRDELADIDAQMQENRIAAVDAIFGQDVNTAIENFADAWGSAWSEGTSKVKAAKDMVRDMMKSMVNESVKATIESSDAMEKIRTKLQQFYADNVLTVAEQDTIIKMAEDLQRELDAQYGWAENLYRDTYSQEGSSRGFESMSQDTASELNGRFATMVEMQAKQLNKSAEISIDTSAIRQTMQLTATNVEEIRNMSLLSIGHLERIAKNTNELYGISNRLAKIEEYTSRL